MARTYRTTWLRRLGNRLMAPLVKLGVGPRGLHLLSVTGRRSGATYTTPVNLVLRDGKRYLVSPYGERAWVQNARAAGQVTLRRGRRSERLAVEELSAEDAAPVLREYWRLNSIARPYFEAGPDASPEAFLREAARHPVFRLR